MSQQRLSPTSFQIIQQLWTALVKAEVDEAPRPMSVGQAFAELENMTQHRRIRELQSRSSLPAILWTILIVGAIITVGSSCLFGTESFSLHFILVFSLTLLVSLVLVAIADIDRPFQGSLHVEPDAFKLAHETFRKLSGPK